MSVFFRVDNEVTESLCIKSKVAQCKCGEPGFEPRSVGASPDEAFPKQTFLPAKSTQFAGHLIIKQVG